MRVLGYRVFRASASGGGCLRSWVMDTVWGRGENVAGCGTTGCGGPPAQHVGRTGCGFHAFAHLRSLRAYADVQRLEEDRAGRPIPWCGPSGPAVICAVVAGFGTVQLGSRGWRGQRAEIVVLFGGSLMAERMADRYQVPLLPLPEDLGWTERLIGGEWGLTHAEALHLPGEFEAA